MQIMLASSHTKLRGYSYPTRASALSAHSEPDIGTTLLGVNMGANISLHSQCSSCRDTVLSKIAYPLARLGTGETRQTIQYLGPASIEHPLLGQLL